MSDHAHPENATIREVAAVEKSLLGAMKAMEERLVAKIDAGFKSHDAEHERMIQRANERHAAIDTILHEDEMAVAKQAGRVEMAVWPIRFLRAVNEFRVLVLGTAALLAWLLGGGHITIG